MQTNIETSEIVDAAAKMAFIAEENSRLKLSNQFLNDIYEAMSAEYMELLIEKYKLVKKLRKVKRAFGWLVRKYRKYKRMALKLAVRWEAKTR